MIGNFYPAPVAAGSQFILAPGNTPVGLVRSTSPATEIANDVWYLAITE